MTKSLQDDETTLAGLNALHPFNGMGEPESVAKAAIFLASEDAGWITGLPLPIDGKYIQPIGGLLTVLTQCRRLSRSMNAFWQSSIALLCLFSKSIFRRVIQRKDVLFYSPALLSQHLERLADLFC